MTVNDAVAKRIIELLAKKKMTENIEKLIKLPSETLNEENEVILMVLDFLEEVFKGEETPKRYKVDIDYENDLTEIEIKSYDDLLKKYTVPIKEKLIRF